MPSLLLATMLLCLPPPTTPQQQIPFQETLSAQSLLGSHFGVPGKPASYDYVVVGGGTAGLTLAMRLAQGGSASVAVVEAGAFSELDNGNLSEIPASASAGITSSAGQANPLVDWQQSTTAQAGILGRVFPFAQGKTLGGNSVRNSMWYHRGSAGSYHDWATLVDDSSYEFGNLLRYFRRSVDFTPPTASPRPANASALADAAAYAPGGGPLKVSYPRYTAPLSSWIARGLAQLGLAEKRGFVNGDLLGQTYIAMTIDPDSATRSSSETAFGRAALREAVGGLTVYKTTLAKRVVFERGRAAGVEVETGGLRYSVAARREVVVSAGAFRSPQLLMVSGVGPAETLQGLGIPVVSERKGVGQNMWDHVTYAPNYEVNVPTLSRLTDPATAAEQGATYYVNRTGTLTSPGADLLAFERVPSGMVSPQTQADIDKTFAPDWPNIEYIAANAWSPTKPPTDGKNYGTLLAALVSPFSRGNVTIRTNSTSDLPIVSPNWLLDPRDKELAVAAFRRARAVFSSPAMAPVVIGQEAYPGPNVTSDGDILRFFQEGLSTVYHPACTCRMGREGDEMAVVDSRARVFGVDGLRVVDASAFAVLPPGHPQASVYALAEKIAEDMSKGD